MSERPWPLAVRKTRSAVRRLARWLASVLRVMLLRLGNGGSVIPWLTCVGAGVSISVTDGGRLELGPGVTIGSQCVIVAQNGTVRIGAHAFIGHGCTIVAKQRIDVGAHALIAEYVTIRDHDHVVDGSQRITDAGFVTAPIMLGEGSWIGAKASVLRGSRIGAGAIVGAHALVKSDVPDRAIAVGIPARVVRFRRDGDAS
jgi:acetyltransferase-like isoleucine patch superfamily enzyme